MTETRTHESNGWMVSRFHEINQTHTHETHDTQETLKL